MFDINFWIRVPSLNLASEDLILGYLFAGLTLVAISCWITRMFIRHKVTKKLLNKIFTVLFTTGLIGLIWFGLRFEATPIFSTRYWAALIFLIGLIWFGFVAKYYILHYRRERSEYDDEALKKKYLP
jgi:uncharacterized membrane protein (DUF485 family)